jgi:hypothetical protein
LKKNYPWFFAGLRPVFVSLSFQKVYQKIPSRLFNMLQKKKSRSYGEQLG